MKFLVLMMSLWSLSSLASDLLPLKVGNEWTYQVSTTGYPYTCRNGLETMKVVGQIDINGTTAYQTRLCGLEGFMAKSGDKIYNYVPAVNEWYLYLSSPVDGGRWHEFRCESQWEALSDYPTALGNLRGCFKKTRLVPYTHVEIFCDQVGMVYDLMIDLNGAGWEKKIVKKNF